LTRSTLFPYTTLFRSLPTDLFYSSRALAAKNAEEWDRSSADWKLHTAGRTFGRNSAARTALERAAAPDNQALVSLVKRESGAARSEEHTSELQSRENL